MKKGCGKRLLKTLRSFDAYGHPIQLQYKSETEYKSSLGGICTILSYGLVFAYFIYLLKTVVGREKYTVTTSLEK